MKAKATLLLLLFLFGPAGFAEPVEESTEGEQPKAETDSSKSNLSLRETIKSLRTLLAYSGKKSIREFPRLYANLQFWLPKEKLDSLTPREDLASNGTELATALHRMIEKSRDSDGLPMNTSTLARLFLADADAEVIKTYQSIYNGEAAGVANAFSNTTNTDTDAVQKTEFTSSYHLALKQQVARELDRGRFESALEIIDDAAYRARTARELPTSLLMQAVLSAHASGQIREGFIWERKLRDRFATEFAQGKKSVVLGRKEMSHEEVLALLRSFKLRPSRLPEARPTEQPAPNAKNIPAGEPVLKPNVCYDLPGHLQIGEFTVLRKNRILLLVQGMGLVVWNTGNGSIVPLPASGADFSASKLLENSWTVTINDKGLTLANLNTGETSALIFIKSKSLVQQGALVQSLTLSPDEKHVLYVESGVLKVVEIATGKLVRSFSTPGLSGFAKLFFQPGEDTFVGIRPAGTAGDPIVLHDFKTGKVTPITPQFEQADAYWDILSVSNNGRALARNPITKGFYSIEIKTGKMEKLPLDLDIQPGKEKIFWSPLANKFARIESLAGKDRNSSTPVLRFRDASSGEPIGNVPLIGKNGLDSFHFSSDLSVMGQLEKNPDTSAGRSFSTLCIFDLRPVGKKTGEVGDPHAATASKTH